MKACIFDLDGTLTDTLDSLEYSVNETMKQIHMPQITKEQCRDFVGNGAKVLIEKALKAGGDEALDRLDEASMAECSMRTVLIRLFLIRELKGCSRH